MNDTAGNSCKISATIANPDGETPVIVRRIKGSGSKKATLEERGLLPGRPHFFVGLGGARSPRESSVEARLRFLVEVYLVSDARPAILFLFTRLLIAIDQVFVSSN